MTHCDNCDEGPATHRAKSQHGEGTFCCRCVHCGEPDVCREEAEDVPAARHCARVEVATYQALAALRPDVSISVHGANAELLAAAEFAGGERGEGRSSRWVTLGRLTVFEDLRK